jgi:hypothetical protein
MRHRYPLFLTAKLDGQIEATFLMADFESQLHHERRSEDHEYVATRSFSELHDGKAPYYIEGEKR